MKTFKIVSIDGSDGLAVYIDDRLAAQSDEEGSLLISDVLIACGADDFDFPDEGVTPPELAAALSLTYSDYGLSEEMFEMVFQNQFPSNFLDLEPYAQIAEYD